MTQAHADFLRVFLVDGPAEARVLHRHLSPSPAGVDHYAAVLAVDDLRSCAITDEQAFAKVSQALEPPPTDLSLFVLLLSNLLALALRLNRMKVAHDAYRQLNNLDLDSLSPELKARLAGARYIYLRAQGKAHLALPLLSEAAKLPLNEGSRSWCHIRELRTMAAMLCLRFGLAEQGLDELGRFARSVEALANLEILRAQLCSYTYQIDEGLEHLDRIDASIPHPRVILVRVPLLLQGRRIAEAEAAITRAERDAPRYLSDLDAARLRACTALVRGDLHQARAYAACIFAQAGNSDIRLVRSHLQLLLDVELAARQAPAARRILQLLDADQDRPDMAMDWARLHLLEGNEACAVQHYRRLLESDSPLAVQGALCFAFEMSALQAERLRYLAQRPGAAPRPQPARHAAPLSLDSGSLEPSFVGDSPAAAAVRASIEQFARVEAAVLITGETGTGKEIVAHRLHSLRPHPAFPFIAVNCGGLSDTLIESELFGHVKGAFTGAIRDHDGLFVAAGRGTIFLDEINSMSPRLQNCLLRVLENGELRPVGSSSCRRISARVITACNRPLDEEVQAGRFRADLFFRLARLHIQIPPLRDRIDDIECLARYFLGSLYPPGQVSMSAELVKALERYGWPGNVRELRNELERISILSGGATILGAELFSPALRSGNVPPRASHEPARGEPAHVSGPPEVFSPWHTQSRRQRMRRLFEQHPRLTRAELVGMLGCSPKTITQDLKQLQAEGLVKRIITSGNLRTSYFTLLR